MRLEVSNFIEHVRNDLEENTDPIKAVSMSKYLRDKFGSYGIKAPIRKEIIRPYTKLVRSLSNADFRELGRYCWEQEQREWQYLWMDFLIKRKRTLDQNDLAFIEELILSKSWWDTVDCLATNGIGPILLDRPKLREEYILKWRNQENIWLIRTALIFQLKYKESTDFNLACDLILQFQNNKEFFIQKACGWILRSYTRVDPLAVQDFLSDNPQLSQLCKTEALKWLKRQENL